MGFLQKIEAVKKETVSANNVVPLVKNHEHTNEIEAMRFALQVLNTALMKYTASMDEDMEAEITRVNSLLKGKHPLSKADLVDYLHQAALDFSEHS